MSYSAIRLAALHVSGKSKMAAQKLQAFLSNKKRISALKKFKEKKYFQTYFIGYRLYKYITGIKTRRNYRQKWKKLAPKNLFTSKNPPKHTTFGLVLRTALAFNT